MRQVSRRWLNCMVVAFTLWFRNKGKTGIGMRRSTGLSGMVPHAFHLKDCTIRVATGYKKRHLIIVDYIPRKSKRMLSDAGDSFLAFKGMYRTRVYEEVVQATSDTLFGSYREAITRTRGEHARQSDLLN